MKNLRVKKELVTKSSSRNGKLVPVRSQRSTRQSLNQITTSSVRLLDDLLVDSPRAFQQVHSDGTVSLAWTPESESILFKAMIEYKLVGIHRHFNVIKVADLLSKAFGFKVNPECVWEHVNTLYSVKELEENNTPLINSKPNDFSLPQSYEPLLVKMKMR